MSSDSRLFFHSVIVAGLVLIGIGCGPPEPRGADTSEMVVQDTGTDEEVDSGGCQPTNGGTEICDGKDNDCDGEIDEEASDATMYFEDSDGDGFGDSSSSETACEKPDGYVEDDSDCDDSAPMVNPEADEVCDMTDNDCDGETDESDATDAKTFYEDSDGDTYGNADASETACEAPAGYVEDDTDCDDTNPSVNPDATETCNGVDTNCDGTRDNPTGKTCSCQEGESQPCGKSEGVCQEGTQTCSGGSWGMCNNSVEPSTEVCDGKDNDCDGDVDEKSAMDAKTFYRDNDGDNYGNPNQTAVGCSAPTGYVENKKDCDDADGKIKPGATETCDGIDNNCDGTPDNPSGGTCNCTQGETQKCGTSTGQCTKGTQMCNSGSFGACMGGTQPTKEICDGKDNDCDGQVDEGVTKSCNKQVGVCSGSTVACKNGSFPSCGKAQFGSNYESGNETSCDNQDNDCDGAVDEGIQQNCSLQKGVCSGATVSCKSGSFQTCGKTQYGSDYEPKEKDQYDGKDNDCDGVKENDVYTKQYGSSGNDHVGDISLNPMTGNLYCSDYTGGNDNAYIRKFDRGFNEQWDDYIADRPGGVAYHSSGIYAGGMLKSSPPQFDLQKTTFTGGYDWDKDLNNAPKATRVSHIATNPTNGDVYAVGWSEGKIGNFTTHHGDRDILVVKYDKDGNPTPAHLFGGAKRDEPWEVAVDPATGDYYVVGRTKSSFNGQTNPGNWSPFVMKLDSGGTEQWTKILGGNATGGAFGVAFDSQRNALYVSGDTGGTIGGQSSQGGLDAFVVRFDRQGNQKWARQFGTSKPEQLFDVAVRESTGEVYLAGRSRGDFGGATNQGGHDIAMAKYDSSGSQKWTRLEGTPKFDDVNAIAVDPTTRDFYVAGETSGNLTGCCDRSKDDAYVMRRKD
mgnify:CR=1 FL=1